VRIGQREADLLENVHSARRDQRPMVLDELLEREAVEILHGVVEDAVLGDSEVEELHAVWRPKRSRGARLPREACHELLVGGIADVEGVWADEFDRRGSRQQRVMSAPDFAHAAAPEALFELVSAHVETGDTCTPRDVVHDALEHHGDDDTDERRQERVGHVFDGGHLTPAPDDGEKLGEGCGEGGREGRREDARGREGDHRGNHHDEETGPADARRRLGPGCERIGQLEQQAAGDEVEQGEIDEPASGKQ